MGGPDDRLARLINTQGRSEGLELVRAMVDEFGHSLALVSSCGAEAAILLDMVAEVDPGLPVIFLETGMMFPETQSYAETLRARFRLTDFRVVRPEPDELAAEAGAPDLWRHDPDRCCHLRKVLPLERALAGFAAWMTGIKRYHNFVRRETAPIQYVDGRFKISPLAAWDPARVEATFRRRDLPRHPLVARGYPSIGCRPCTSPVAAGEDCRAGRWNGSEKTECGLHRPIFGKPA